MFNGRWALVIYVISLSVALLFPVSSSPLAVALPDGRGEEKVAWATAKAEVTPSTTTAEVFIRGCIHSSFSFVLLSSPLLLPFYPSQFPASPKGEGEVEGWRGGTREGEEEHKGGGTEGLGKIERYIITECT